MYHHSPLVEIRKQALEFELLYARRPTEVTMHPRVWADLLNFITCTDPVKLDSIGEWEVMGMRVVRDPKFPGIQILVS